MKGQSYELIESIIGVILLGMLLFYMNYEIGSKNVRITKKLNEFSLDQSSSSTLISLYLTRIPTIKKYYAEALIDGILQGKSMNHPLDKVFYGASIGKLNNTEIIDSVFEKYLDKKWELLVATPEGEMNYGTRLHDNLLYVYTLPLPVPDERIGNITLKIGKP